MPVQADQTNFVPVLVYHHTNDKLEPSDTIINLSQFELHLQMLQREQYTTITVSQLTDFMLGKTLLPTKSVVLTFDDGWRDNLDAAKLMEKYNVSGTFFVCSSFIHKEQNMSEQEIQQLSTNPLFEIGAHSHTHFIEWSDNLDGLDTRIVVGEALMSKRLLERMIQKPISSFAWPYGHYSEELIEYAAYIGFTSSLTVDSKSVNRKGASPLKIPRITVNGKCTAENVKHMIETGSVMKCGE